MKLIKIIISAALVVMAVYGWLTVGREVLTAPSEFSTYVKEGDKSLEEGLYEDAYQKYTAALAIKSSKKVTEKQVQAYSLFYEKEEKGQYSVQSQLLSVLDEARHAYPRNAEYPLQEIDLYLDEKDFESAKHVCEQALDENEKNEELRLRWNEIIRSYTLGYTYYTGYREQNSDKIAVTSGVTWQWLNADGTEGDSHAYEVLGQIGTEGLFLAKEEDKEFRFYDMDGIARGVANGAYISAGSYQEELCPAEKAEGEWYYLNLDGEEVLGPYRQAGCFAEGMAAVQNDDGKWCLIDKKGEKKQNSEFFDIRLDLGGAWINEGVMLAAKKKGQYQLFDENLKQIGKQTFDDVDVPTEYGIYAFKKNEKWGYVNSEGKIISEPKYEQAKSFRNGLSAVCDAKGRWGYVTENQELVVDYQFLEAGYVTAGGTAMVSDKEKGMYRMLLFSYPEELVE